MDDKLKACPRCGREQWTDKERGDTIPYQKKMRRRCDWCDLETRDWNNRPIEDDLRAVIGSLRRQVGILKQHYSNAIKTQDEFRGLYDTAQEEIERLKKEMDAIVSLDELIVEKGQQIKAENARLKTEIAAYKNQTLAGSWADDEDEAWKNL